MAQSSRKSSASTIAWNEIAPAPVVLVSGGERLLSDRARTTLIARCREAQPSVEITEFEAGSYESGSLQTLTSPSLFNEPKLIVVEGVEASSDAFITDALGYLGDTAPDVVMLLRHHGGQRGKKLLDAIKKSGAPIVDAQPIKNESDRAAFAQAEFARANRKITREGLAAVMDAVGSDVAELAAGCRQLIDDTSGPITDEVVGKYYGGRKEATGFKVADAAVAGNTGLALSLLRHALATGTDPVPLVAVAAMKFRGMAKVAGLRGGSGQLAGQLGMAPWQVDRARREVQRWNEEALADAIIEIAAADEAVKGGGRDPVYALEHMIIEVCRAAHRR